MWGGALRAAISGYRLMIWLAEEGRSPLFGRKMIDFVKRQPAVRMATP